MTTNIKLNMDKDHVYACKEALAEMALDRMADNAREMGLKYCKHGSDNACKECYMENANKSRNMVTAPLDKLENIQRRLKALDTAREMALEWESEQEQVDGGCTIPVMLRKDK